MEHFHTGVRHQMHGTGGNSYYQMIQIYMTTTHSTVGMLAEERFHGRAVIIEKS